MITYRHIGDSASTTEVSSESPVEVTMSSEPEFALDPRTGAATSSTNPLFLGEECPEILDEDIQSNKACLDAVEQRLMDKAAYTLDYFGMAPKNAPFTYRSMLENREKDRELVVEALSRSECRLLEGPIRLDLRETCNAEAFFRYALFTELCDSSRYIQDYFKPRADMRAQYEDAIAQYERAREQYLGEMSQESQNRKQRGENIALKPSNIRKKMEDLRTQYGLDDYRSGDDGTSRYQSTLIALEDFKDMEPPASFRMPRDDDRGWYYSWRNHMREGLLRDIWLNTKGMCPSDVSIGSPNTRDGCSTDNELFGWWNESKEKSRQNHPLTEVAARLGDERLIVIDAHIAKVSGKEFNRSKKELFPWIGQLQEALWSESPLLAARGLVGLRNAGYEADIEGIVKVLCGTRSKETEYAEDCAKAIGNAEEQLDATDLETLRALDEIAEVALKLDVYQHF